MNIFVARAEWVRCDFMAVGHTEKEARTALTSTVRSFCKRTDNPLPWKGLYANVAEWESEYNITEMPIGGCAVDNTVWKA